MRFQKNGSKNKEQNTKTRNFYKNTRKQTKYHFDKQKRKYTCILLPQTRIRLQKKYIFEESRNNTHKKKTKQTTLFFKKNPQKDFTEIIISIIL